MSTDGVEGPNTDQVVVFEDLSAEAFRGFNARAEFDLDASIVLAHGPNGMGKTSLFDAMQWLLLGQLARVGDVRLRRTEEHIVNAYRPGGTATVEAHVRLVGKRVHLSRTGDRSGSSLVWSETGREPLYGDAAEEALEDAFSASERMDLQTSLTACGLLQQDASRLVLKSKPSDRFAIFSQLLGLSDLERFEDWTQARARRAAASHRSASEALTGAERAAVAARDQLSKALERASQRPAVEAIAGRLSEAIRASRFIKAAPPASRDEAVALNAASARLGQELESLAVTIAALGDIEGTISEGADRSLDDEIAAADSAAQDLEARLETQREALLPATDARDSAMTAQQGLQRMAAAVLPQLVGSTCPVCGQGIDVDEIRRHMEELAGDTGAVDRLQAAVADLEEQVEQTRAELAASRSYANDLRAEARRRAQHEQEVAYLRQRLASLQATGPMGTEMPPAEFHELMSWVQSARSEVALVAGVTQEYIAAIDASGGAEEVRATQAVSSAEANLRDLEAARQSAELARKEAETLHEVAQAARLDVVRSEFARLSPLAQNVFSRLDPHPTFTELELKTDVLRSASTATARVRDVLQDVAADPMVIFSSAQANIAAISYLISLNWAAAGRVPVLLLDDPLQAMDDINVLGFADLCRHLRIKRQVVVSTHERRFAQLLERKLTPRHDGHRTIVHEFVGWARSGPLVKTRSA